MEIIAQSLSFRQADLRLCRRSLLLISVSVSLYRRFIGSVSVSLFLYRLRLCLVVSLSVFRLFDSLNRLRNKFIYAFEKKKGGLTIHDVIIDFHCLSATAY